MASYEIPVGTQLTYFNTADGSFSFATVSGSVVVFDDGDAGDVNFDTVETLSITSDGSPSPVTATFVGTAEVGGLDYPLFALSNGVTIVVGTQLSAGAFPNLSSLTIDTSTVDASTLLCFAEGTEILTPDGPVAVEALAPGDLVCTAGGRVVPVRWVGRKTVSTRFACAERLRLVRVRAGALGKDLPRRDLMLTPDHGLCLDGLIVNAGALVNGHGIDWVLPSELGDRYTVYHVETEDHDIILAEGAPAETYIDYVGRQAFDNYADYVARHGEDRTIPELPHPRISAARMLPATLRARLGLDTAA